MRRRKPDTMEIQQMKTQAREERARKEVHVFYKLNVVRQSISCDQNIMPWPHATCVFGFWVEVKFKYHPSRLTYIHTYIEF